MINTNRLVGQMADRQNGCEVFRKRVPMCHNQGCWHVETSRLAQRSTTAVVDVIRKEGALEND